MNIAKAFANNDVVLLVWSYEDPIANCLGFCIKRTNVITNKIEVLTSMVGFSKSSIQTRQFKPTIIWPIQKFNWRDFTATSGQTYIYSIIPMIGEYDDLIEKKAIKLDSNEVTLSPGNDKIKAFFNKGILATQYLSSQVPKSASGIPNYRILQDRIKQAGDQLRNKLADDLRIAVMSTLQRAIDEDGKCYCALYELNDQELLAKLLEAGDRVHLILSNTGQDDGTNETSRASLQDSSVNLINRMVGSGHIGHNKFIVYVTKSGTPSIVMTGSTNWTHTGLCAQSNNAILIQSRTIAKQYYNYWHRLKDDNAAQSTEFRASNNQALKSRVDGSKISLWFSPNTKQKNKTATSAIPKDMEEVFTLMNNAKKSILFLAFQPGSPSIIDEAAKIQLLKPDLFIRGAATDNDAIGSSAISLYHRGINDPVFVGVAELKDDFSYWMAEILKSSPYAKAVIHDKVMVIDAFTPDCVVITGSHNLGYRASYNNDENLLIIKHHQQLATCYATHILDIYDHYRWRYFVNKNSGQSTFTGLNKKDSWQAPYFNNKRGESIDKRFWL